MLKLAGQAHGTLLKLTFEYIIWARPVGEVVGPGVSVAGLSRQTVRGWAIVAVCIGSAILQVVSVPASTAPQDLLR